MSAANGEREGSGFGSGSGSRSRSRSGSLSGHADLLDDVGGDGDDGRNRHGEEDEGDNKGDVSGENVDNIIKDGRGVGGRKRRRGIKILKRMNTDSLQGGIGS